MQISGQSKCFESPGVPQSEKRNQYLSISFEYMSFNKYASLFSQLGNLLFRPSLIAIFCSQQFPSPTHDGLQSIECRNYLLVQFSWDINEGETGSSSNKNTSSSLKSASSKRYSSDIADQGHIIDFLSRFQ